MIIQEEMYIRSLKRTRKIDIYVPDDYQTSKKRYPVLIINDGQNAFFDEQSYIGKSWGFLQAVKQLNIDVICVDENLRGKGIGTKILEHIKEFAKENNCTDLYLTVNEENLDAIKLYEKFGFQLKNIAYSMKIK